MHCFCSLWLNFSCDCHAGYKLNQRDGSGQHQRYGGGGQHQRGQQCIDIDECQIDNGGCQQVNYNIMKAVTFLR